LIVVYSGNLINVVMALLFVVRISNLPQVEDILGIVVMIMGFGLGYIAFAKPAQNIPFLSLHSLGKRLMIIFFLRLRYSYPSGSTIEVFLVFIPVPVKTITFFS